MIILFCWVIYPYKWIKAYTFKRRLNKAIKKADARQKTTPCKVLVVQFKGEFIVGIPSELKKIDNLVRKRNNIPRKYKKVWDYRNAIVYSAKNN